MQLVLPALAGAFVFSCGVAVAQPLPPEDQRTVAWYALHPSERVQVRRICLNDPGHLMHSPDCVNAKRGDLDAALRTSRLDMSSPDSPEYWARRPRDRANKIAMCAHMTSEHQFADRCDVPRQSLLSEQRLAHR